MATRPSTSRNLVRETLARGQRVPTAIGRFILGRAQPKAGRVFVVVSKAVAKKSTSRNRIKRQLREWARREALGKRLGRDVVVFVAPDIATLTRKAFRERMARALAELRLTSDNS